MIIIACADREWGIGRNSKLLFNIPEDMEFFKNATKGKTVVMGRKTFESLRIKPLPGRRNIVLTRSEIFSFEDTETVHSLTELFSLLENTPKNDVFVIGGSNVYRQLLKYCDTAYITKVFSYGKADSFIADFDKLSEWKTECASEIMDSNGIEFQFVKYVRNYP
ncbi:MAG: dihydrofolate reductase [Oscillospiraceae bacterium]|nr:dihydrofolate reductase [Oscillospiraceae bacterium]